MDQEEQLTEFVAAHLQRRGVTPLCTLGDGRHSALLAADGDELVLVLVTGPSVRPANVRVDRIAVEFTDGEPVRLDHEEAAVRLSSPT